MMNKLLSLTFASIVFCTTCSYINAGSLLESSSPNAENGLYSKRQFQSSDTILSNNAKLAEQCAREFDKCNDIVRCCEPSDYYCVKPRGNFAYGYCLRAY